MTPTPPALDLAALTVIAKAVEPTEWTVAFGGVGTSVYSNWDNEHGDYAKLIADGLSSEEADHIAAFDPPTVLALIARAEELAGESYLHETAVKEAIARAEAAEAKVAAVRAMAERFWPESLADAVPRTEADRTARVIATRLRDSLDGTA